MLFGNLLAITHQQLLTFTALLLVIAVTVVIVYRPLLFASVNAQVAEAKACRCGCCRSSSWRCWACP